MVKKITKTTSETQKLAGKLVKEIYKLQDQQKAVIVALVGDLGAGKTVFTQGLAKALGIKEKITSPTFVILKKFKIPNPKFKTLIHIDAYRIDDPKEILDLDWEETSNNPDNIILIEWAEKIRKILHKPYFLLEFHHQDEKKRGIDIRLIK